MAEALIVEVALGAAAESLLAAVVHVKERALNFESILTKLQNTLESVIPKIKRIERLKALNDLPTDEIKKLMLRLQKAEEIVNRCAKILRWNYCKKYKYSRVLMELDVSLCKIFGSEVEIQIWEDAVMLLVEIKEANRKLDDLFKRNVGISIFSRGGNIVLFLASGLKKNVQFMLQIISPYLGSLIQARRWGYKRIKASFCPNSWTGEQNVD